MKQSELTLEMSRYEKGSVSRINHFLKVYAFAKAIGGGEQFPSELQDILETAALVHDIGIKPSLEKYGSSAGEYQEKEGPEAARVMLENLGYPDELIKRVCFLVGHHHTYQDIDGQDYQALVEADFLVNIFEGNMDASGIREVRQRIFRTATGTRLLDTLYL